MMGLKKLSVTLGIDFVLCTRAAQTMEQSLWWYLLAGVSIGFSISWLWEWLYFRRKRLVLTDRRIAELEAALRSASRAQQDLFLEEAEAWPAASYRSPDVFLETEAPHPTEAQPPVHPLPQPAVAVAAVAASAGAAPPPPVAPVIVTPARAPTATKSTNGHNGQHAKPDAGGVPVAVVGGGASAEQARTVPVHTPAAAVVSAPAAGASSQSPEVTASEIKQLAASIHALLDQMSGSQPNE